MNYYTNRAIVAVSADTLANFVNAVCFGGCWSEFSVVGNRTKHKKRIYLFART